METMTTYASTSGMRFFDGIKTVKTINHSTIVSDYKTIYDRNTKLFVFEADTVSIAKEYYASSPVSEQYNDLEKNTVRQDILFTDGRDVYAYDADTGGLGKLYKISETLFTVVSDDVYGDVCKTSEYLAAKRTGEDARLYETARATKYNSELLDTFFGEAAETADLKLKDFVKKINKETPTLSYIRVFKYKSRCNLSMWEFARQSLRSFFVHFVLAQWLDTCGMEESDRFRELAIADLDDVLTKMNYRDLPERDVRQQGDSSMIKGTGSAVLLDVAQSIKDKYIKG